MKLLFTSGDFVGQSCRLPSGKSTVGRSENNTIAIHDESVSKEHCEILVHGTEVIVRERRSSNGTFVNDSRVHGQQAVRNGAVIRFGRVEARIDFELPDAPLEEPTAMTAVRFLAPAPQGEADAPVPQHATIQNRNAPPTQQTVEHTMMMPGTKVTIMPNRNASVSEDPGSKPVYRVLIVVVGAIILAAVVWWLTRGR